MPRSGRGSGLIGAVNGNACKRNQCLHSFVFVLFFLAPILGLVLGRGSGLIGAARLLLQTFLKESFFGAAGGEEISEEALLRPRGDILKGPEALF